MASKGVRRSWSHALSSVKSKINPSRGWLFGGFFFALSDNALLHASLFEDSLLSLSHYSREEGG